MKKLFFLFGLLAFVSLSAFAQDTTSTGDAGTVITQPLPKPANQIAAVAVILIPVLSLLKKERVFKEKITSAIAAVLFFLETGYALYNIEKLTIADVGGLLVLAVTALIMFLKKDPQPQP